LKKLASKSRVAGANWQTCEVLIVDEVSALPFILIRIIHPHLFLYSFLVHSHISPSLPPSHPPFLLQVSMLHGSLLSKLDAIAKHVKNQPYLPFGGVQLIFTGDFFQLPP